MGKISSQVSKGLGAAIQEVKNKINEWKQFDFFRQAKVTH